MGFGKGWNIISSYISSVEISWNIARKISKVYEKEKKLKERINENKK